MGAGLAQPPSTVAGAHALIVIAVHSDLGRRV